MKKTFALILILLAATLLLCGCDGGVSTLLPPSGAPTEEPPPTPTPEPTKAPYSGSIDAVEVNQALSFGFDTGSGEYYAMDTFVSKKDTVVFARLSKFVEVDFTGKTQYMEVTRGDELVAVIAPSEFSFGQNLCFSVSGDEAWLLTAGDYEFTVFVDGATAKAGATLRDTRKLDILMVPMLCNYDGSVYVPSEDWQELLWLTKACFPLSADSYNVTVGEQIDISTADYDLTENDGAFDAWYELYKQRGDYDLVFGFVSGPVDVTRTQDSYSCGGGVYLIATDKTTPEALVAHEIAQYFGVGDEYEGGLLNLSVNPAPVGVSGFDMADRETSVTSRNYRVQDGEEYGLYGSGSVIYGEQIPFDAARQSLYDCAACFMGDVDEYTTGYWISSAVWEYLYKEFTDLTEPAPASSVEGLRVTATISDAGVFEMISYENGAGAAYAESAEDGEYTLTATDAEGETMAEYRFSPDFFLATNPPSQSSKHLIEVTLPFPDGWADLTLTGPVTTTDEDGVETTAEDVIWTTVEPEAEETGE